VFFGVIPPLSKEGNSGRLSVGPDWVDGRRLGMTRIGQCAPLDNTPVPQVVKKGEEKTVHIVRSTNS